MKICTPKEKYNAVIFDIENEIYKDEFARAKDIADTIIENNNIYYGDQGKRDLAAVMNFMTGKPLISYIKERKMMCACEKLLSNREKCDILSVVELAGYSDQQAFSKAFKKSFSTTPQKAWEEQNVEIAPPQTWEVVSEYISLDKDSVEIEVDSMSDSIFGMSQEQYQKISKIYELRSIYGFDEMMCRIAYEFSEEKSIAIEDVFEYISSFDFFNPNEENIGLINLDKVPIEEKECIVKNVIFDKEIIYCYFNCGIKEDVGFVVNALHHQGVDDIISEDVEIINLWYSFEMTISYHILKDAVAAYYKASYQEHGNDVDGENFEDYLDCIGRGMSIDFALESTLPYAHLFDDFSCSDDDIHSKDDDSIQEYLDNYAMEKLMEAGFNYEKPDYYKSDADNYNYFE